MSPRHRFVLSCDICGRDLSFPVHGGDVLLEASEHIYAHMKIAHPPVPPKHRHSITFVNRDGTTTPSYVELS